MFAYANDNNGDYPGGKNSTEVFQKLLDGGYVSDPTLFYIPTDGKRRPVVGQKLKPENVCWDVTAGVDLKSPDGVPLVFMTGYKVIYGPGTPATPIIKPYPQFGGTRTWEDWWNNETPWGAVMPGIAVYYKANNAMFLKSGAFVASRNNGGTEMGFDANAASKGIIPNFIPPDFKPDGMPYRQLTPDGPLP
jgi:hypothetical protein